MKYFHYVEPKSLDEACRLLKDHENAKLLAGGVSLTVLLKNNLLSPSHLVNLKTVSGLDQIEWNDREGLKIGALNRHRDILHSPIVREHFPILAEAASKIATPPIRNLGTIGGNIAHAEPSADFPPSLIVLNASLRLKSVDGERKISIEDFFTDYYENVLTAGEILVGIDVPPLPAQSGGSYVKLDKVANALAIVGVAAVLSLDERGTCTYAGIGLGGVAPTPLKVKKAEQILVGRKISNSYIDQVAREAQATSHPTDDVNGSAEYRKEMVHVLTRRALREALGRATHSKTEEPDRPSRPADTRS